MEIRDPVHGTMELSAAETAIIDTPEFQRLRAIKQLGFAEFSFPGATHNRYLHSLGVCHVAGLAFDQLCKNHQFSSEAAKKRFRQAVRLGALLHDVGHGPLSHTTEEVMPLRKDLSIKIYEQRQSARGQVRLGEPAEARADHEDYTIKYLTDSPLSDEFKRAFSDITPLHIACLIDKTLQVPDDFFVDNGVDYRTLLSQMVSSELDCDRLDYLERDSYFCGTNYGKVDLHWLMSNFAVHVAYGRGYLALNRRALYTFDDFLISRHHMHLMVYFHHKSIIYEEMLNRYLTSPDCQFFLPPDINEYTKYNDYKLFEHLAGSKNEWAQRIAQRRPYKMLIELHSTSENLRATRMEELIRKEGIDVINAGSQTRLSKYHAQAPEDRGAPIYVVDQYDRWDRPAPIDQSTEIFQKYEGARVIDRLYVAPENYDRAAKILSAHRI